MTNEINKEACRLKDIIELFIDSGLGREAFSIISQGKVEEILSSKAEDRRTLFEEAAGVLKYKQRKRKAEFKLTETKNNLSRVDDIVYELNQQLEHLAKQSKRANEYVELEQQLKVEERALLVTEIEQISSEWRSYLNKIEKDKHDESDLKIFISNQEAQVELKQAELIKLDQYVDNLQENLLLSTQELEKLQGRKQLLTEQVKNFLENKDKTISMKESTVNQKNNSILSLIKKITH